MALTTAAASGVAPLIHQVGLVHYVVSQNVEGVTHEDSLVQPRAAGNCLNWVIGHLCHSRNNLLDVVGQTPFWTTEISERYKRGSNPITNGADAQPFEDMVAQFTESQTALVNGMSSILPEQLNEKAPFSPVDDPNETIGSLLSAFVFHEAYTAGQTGLLRRILGKTGAIQ